MFGDEKLVGVVVFGLGNVGSEVVCIIENSVEDFVVCVGVLLVLWGIGVCCVMIDCGVLIELLIDDIEEFVVCEDVDIVVEVMGLVELLCKVILGVFECGKFVVMVNKVLFVIFIGELV